MSKYRYTIKKGYENRTFSGEGIRRISDTEIESDRELFSNILTPTNPTPEPKRETVQPPATNAPVADTKPANQPQTANQGSEQ